MYQKISILGPGAKYDTCGPRDFGATTSIPGVYHAKIAGGNICRLFKVLQTNVCQNNCNYCAFRKDRTCERAATTSDEMAQAFNLVHKKRLVDGLFLSSGIVDTPQSTMTRLLDTLTILRSRRYNYTGYIHLKLMPGTPQSCIQEALTLANRISINIEAPTPQTLAALSPDKNLRNGFFDTLSLAKKEITKFKLAGKRIPSITTQFIVGAGAEKDSDIVHVTDFLYKKFGLARVFYSAFRPVSQTPLEYLPETPITRAHRLYQTDFLMRFYKFTPEDISFNENGFLFDDIDPKLVWAKNHPEIFPINLNKAAYWELLKIPGIGPTSAKKIIKLRNQTRISDITRLLGNRISITKAAPYVSC